MKHIASVSFGKDSLYMLLRLIETGTPLDEVVFYDTGMEFQAIYDARDAVLPLLAKHGIAYKELTPPRTVPFFIKCLTSLSRVAQTAFTTVIRGAAVVVGGVLLTS